MKQVVFYLFCISAVICRSTLNFDDSNIRAQTLFNSGNNSNTLTHHTIDSINKFFTIFFIYNMTINPYDEILLPMEDKKRPTKTYISSDECY